MIAVGPAAGGRRRPRARAVAARRHGRPDRAVHAAGAVGDLGAAGRAARQRRRRGPRQRRQRPGRARSAAPSSRSSPRSSPAGRSCSATSRCPIAAVVNALPIIALAPVLNTMFDSTSSLPRRLVVGDHRVLPGLRQHAARPAARSTRSHRELMRQLRGGRLDRSPALVRLPGALPVRLHRAAAGVVPRGHRRGRRRVLRRPAERARRADHLGGRVHRLPPGVGVRARRLRPRPRLLPGHARCSSGSRCPGNAARPSARRHTAGGDPHEEALMPPRSAPWPRPGSPSPAAARADTRPTPAATRRSGGALTTGEAAAAVGRPGPVRRLLSPPSTRASTRTQGLDVQILEGGVDIVPQTVLAKGKADYAIAWVPKALASREQGAEITDVGADLPALRHLPGRRSTDKRHHRPRPTSRARRSATGASATSSSCSPA